MTDDVREKLLERLANGAEQLHPDVDGRRAASERLLQDLYSVLTEAETFEPRAYAARFDTTTSLLVGDVVTIRIDWKGNIKIRLVDIMGEKLPIPELKYNARRHAWEHATQPEASPLDAVLDVIQPVVLAAARRRDRPGAGSSSTTGSTVRVSQFWRGRMPGTSTTQGAKT